MLHWLQAHAQSPHMRPGSISLPCQCRDELNMWKLALYGIITLHVLLRLFIYWNVKFASRAQFSRASLDAATDVLVLPMEFSGLPEFAALQHRVLVRHA